MDTQHLVVFCTCPDLATAEHIARAVVTARLAACVNILSGITSVYRWQEELHSDAELLLLIKTHHATYVALENRIRDLHPYDVPEIIALPIQQGAADYLAWLNASLSDRQG
jgi:periplasmic divalent cation tolerance protein